MLGLLRTIAWLACIVYSTIPAFWLMIHPFAESWRSRQRNPYKILLPLWIASWLAMGLLTRPWRRILLYAAQWTWVPAATMFCFGIAIYVLSVRGFSKTQLGGVPEVVEGNDEQSLVTTGLRSRVRHPVYLGHLCEMLAWSVGSGLAVTYALTGFAVITGAIMIRMEDVELEDRFGQQYRAYRDRVPAVLPRPRSQTVS